MNVSPPLIILQLFADDDAGDVIPAAFGEGFFRESLRIIRVPLAEDACYLLVAAHIGQTVAAYQHLAVSELDGLVSIGSQPHFVVVHAEESYQFMRVGAAAYLCCQLDVAQLLSGEGMVLREASELAAAVVIHAAVTEVEAVDHAVIYAHHSKRRAAPAAFFLPSHAADTCICGVGEVVDGAVEPADIHASEDLRALAQRGHCNSGSELAVRLSAHAVADRENITDMASHSLAEEAALLGFYAESVRIEAVLVAFADEAYVRDS